MLLKFGLRNFKAFRDQSFDLAPITVFVGRNGTGKSSVLQALAFLKQSSLVGEATYAARDGAPGSEPVHVLADLGGFAEVVHGGDTALPVEITLAARLDSLGPTPWPAIRRHIRYARQWQPVVGEYPIALDYRCALQGDSPAAEVVGVQPEGAFRIQAPADPDPNGERTANRSHEIRPTRLRQFRNFDAELIRGSRVQPRPFLAKTTAALEEDIVRLGKALPIQLRRFFFIQAGRGFIGQTFPLQDDASSDLAASAGYIELSKNAATTLAMDRDLEEQVSDWLEGITGLRMQARIRQGKSVSIVFQSSRGANGRMFVGANNESFGANQLSHVFLQIALAGNKRTVGKEATIGIEEPEIHLHPRAQRVFVETLAAIAKQGTQFIISTHSERIVSRILVLVAKGALRREDIAVYAFDKDEHGVASAEKREIDEMGRIHGGIPGFFEENIEDMSEIMAALKEKA